MTELVKKVTPRSLPVRIGSGLWKTYSDFLHAYNEIWQDPEFVAVAMVGLIFVGVMTGGLLGIALKIGSKAIIPSVIGWTLPITINIALNILRLPFLFLGSLVKNIRERIPKE